jgi:lysophospholipase L1-like esterase
MPKSSSMLKNIPLPAAALIAAAFGFAQTSVPAPLPPVRIILVGDSTVAVKSGWGSGFCADVAPQLTCVNMAKGGRSTSSYRAEGSWAQVMDQLKRNSQFAATYVLIQFGHNDQPGKPGRSTDLATEFPANLRQYVEEVKGSGGQAVLITSLTRRSFKDGQVKDDLLPWADATKKVAADEGVPVLDLNADSIAAVNKMGPVEANTLAMAPPPPIVAASAASGNSMPAPKAPVVPANTVERQGEAAPLFDYTHLGEKGSVYFGRMVANELIAAVPGLQPYIKP